MFKKFSSTTTTLLICAFNIIFSSLTIEAQPAVEQTAVDFTQVAKKATPAVVSIKVKGLSKKSSNPWGFSDDENEMFGGDFFKKFFNIRPNEIEPSPTFGQASGFITSTDGHVLTNSHVVSEAKEITVILTDGREFPGKVVGQDPNTDIALIKIDAQDLPFLQFSDSDTLQPGQWAIAIGNPMGLQASLTVGVISATGRNNLDLARIEDFIQTDAAINRGNSGGPLLNFAGEVIGMNTAIATNISSGGYMGIGFAIPSNILQHIMQELLSTGKVSRGFIGVVLQAMDANLAKAFNLSKTEGALVAQVTKDSPAEKAGLKSGDIIIKYNQTPVHSIAGLRNSIALMKPGSKIVLSVLRNNQPLEITVGIGTFPESEDHIVSAYKGENISENIYGFSVQNLSEELAKKLGYEDDKGVLISEVNSGSLAAKIGLKKETLILEINQHKISNVTEFNKELEALKKGTPLLMLIKQDKSVRFVSLLIN